MFLGSVDVALYASSNAIFITFALQFWFCMYMFLYSQLSLLLYILFSSVSLTRIPIHIFISSVNKSSNICLNIWALCLEIYLVRIYEKKALTFCAHSVCGQKDLYSCHSKSLLLRMCPSIEGSCMAMYLIRCLIGELEEKSWYLN